MIGVVNLNRWSEGLQLFLGAETVNNIPRFILIPPITPLKGE